MVFLLVAALNTNENLNQRRAPQNIPLSKRLNELRAQSKAEEVKIPLGSSSRAKCTAFRDFL
jgi:hypothetical protein